MPEVTVTERAPVELERAWEVMSDLSRLHEWLSLHEDWRSELPEEIGEGTELSSVIAFKGMRNRIAWKVEEFSPPEAIALRGDGKGGTKAALRFSAAAESEETEVSLYVEFSNPALRGPLGGVAARSVKGELKKSIKRLAELAA